MYVRCRGSGGIGVLTFAGTKEEPLCSPGFVLWQLRHWKQPDSDV